MEHVMLGRTGLGVSRIGFGGAPAGLTNYLGAYSPADPAQRRQVIDAVAYAAEQGITYFDTAQSYGDGESERIFGEALAGAAQRVVVATKVGFPIGALPQRVEQSMGRLRRDRLDVLQLHGGTWTDQQADEILGDGGVLDQLCALREQGLIRYIGFTSEDSNPALYRLIRSNRFDVMQIQYNLMFQHPAEPSRPMGSMYEAERHQLGIVTMRTMTSGLFGRWLARVNPANTFDYAPALLQFVLSNPLVDVALVGMRSRAEVDASVRIEADRSGRIDLAELFKRFVSP